jgi:hypothetical protein
MLDLEKNSVLHEICADAEIIGLGDRNIVHIEHKDILQAIDEISHAVRVLSIC